MCVYCVNFIIYIIINCVISTIDIFYIYIYYKGVLYNKKFKREQNNPKNE